MNSKSIFYTSSLIILSLFACKSPEPIADVDIEVTDLDTVEVTPKPELEIYRATNPRINDLLHTKLEVSFDWDSTFLYGKAQLSFTPYFYDTDSLTLDAKGFQIKEVALLDQLGKKQALEYEYDSLKLKINLDKTYTRKDTYRIFIDYIAMPERLEAGGSSAIRSEKGLYFINPDGKDPNKPKQIWTQGETESSSCWFPTIDSPNEKTTQEIYITVDTLYETLSNGKLLFQTDNGDGSRTDYWKQELPHSPYLFMMAIGDFAIVEDQWRDIPVNYYVEHKFEEYAADIYPNTPEMLEFFSNKLGYDYPWDKFHQVVVRDYVSGAMENTGAVIYGEFVQGDDRFLIDNSGEDVVAHELFHHWFGDLVTTESWSNLPLNESFATYGEYLWNEHKYGKDQADYGLDKDLEAYFSEARINRKKLIRYSYSSEMEMFDTHSYQKGGRVLHMLRKEVGDEAFFKSLQHYLKENEFQAAEIDHLRLAFEEITGRDLHWFFNQWFMKAGHPELEVEHNYIDSTNTLVLNIQQVQEGDEVPPIYILPIEVEIVNAKGEKMIKSIKMDQREQTFNFQMEQPQLVNVDADKSLLANLDQEFSEKEAIVLYRKGGNYLDRYIAIKELKYKKDSAALNTLEAAINDPFWGIRKLAIKQSKALTKKRPESTLELLLEATKDSVSDVRAEALQTLSKYYEDKIDLAVIKKGLNDRSYMVVGTALEALQKINPEEALMEAEKLETVDNANVSLTIARIYSKESDPKHNEFFMKKLSELSGFTKYPLIISYQEYIEEQDDAVIEKSLSEFKKIGEEESSWFMRMGGVNALISLKGKYEDEQASIDKQLSEEGVSNAEELKERQAKAAEMSNKIATILKELAEKEESKRLKSRIERELN